MGIRKASHRTLISLIDHLRNVMGLQLRTSTHMGHKYLHKHTMPPFTFVGTYRYSHTYRRTKKRKEK